MLLASTHQAAVVPPARPTMTTGLGLTHILPFSLNSLGLLPNLASLDTLHRPLRSTLPCPSPPRRKPLFCCNICQIRFNSEGQALAHYKGSKHGKKLKASEESKYKSIGNAMSPGVSEEDRDTEWSIGHVTLNVQVSQTKTCPASTNEGHMSKSSPMDTSVVQPACSNLVQEKTVQQSVGSHMGKGSVVTTRETEDEKASRLLYCSLCKVAVNSASQLQGHNKGLKHKMMMEARNGGGAIKAFPRHSSKFSIRQPFNRGSELQDKTFYCEICDVYVNSESQLKQHIISRRHKDHIAGRTPKAKFIRCRRRNTWHQSSPPVRAQQHKHPYQMNAASATLSNVFSSSFGLFPTMQPPQTAGPMFSTPVPRSTASFLRFLHPGHGPMRSRCIPVIFAPY